MKGSVRRTLTGYAFIGPWVVGLIILTGYPFAASFYFSLCDYPPMRGPLFMGAANYREMIMDSVFRQSMGVTMIYAAIAIPLGAVIALSLALLLNSRIRGRALYRVIFYLPHLVPSVVVAILWMWMFNPQYGILNLLLKPFTGLLSLILQPFARLSPDVPGWIALVALIVVFIAWRFLKSRASSLHRGRRQIPEYVVRNARALFVLALIVALSAWIQPSDLEKVRSPGWLTDANPFPSGLSIAPSWALWALICMSTWGVGQMAVIYLAKLQDVPIELYEVAELDGANRWQKIRNITLPMISPVILFNVVMGTIGAFQVFAEPYIMTGGGPEDKTRFAAMFIYDQAFQYQRLGYASAVAWVLFLVVVALTLIALRVSRKKVYYAARK